MGSWGGQGLGFYLFVVVETREDSPAWLCTSNWDSLVSGVPLFVV